jgi:hypothetical protein
MPDRPHSEAIRQRFVTAVETLAASGYPADSTIVSITRSVGMEPSNYYGLRKVGRYPTMDNCVELCLQYGINPLWLFMGEGAMKKVNGSKGVSAIEMLKNAVMAIEVEMKKAGG